jgi:hypothetical protein
MKKPKMLHIILIKDLALSFLNKDHYIGIYEYIFANRLLTNNIIHGQKLIIEIFFAILFYFSTTPPTITPHIVYIYILFDK